MKKKTIKPRDPHWRARRALGHRVHRDAKKHAAKTACRRRA